MYKPGWGFFFCGQTGFFHVSAGSVGVREGDEDRSWSMCHELARSWQARSLKTRRTSVQLDFHVRRNIIIVSDVANTIFDILSKILVSIIFFVVFLTLVMWLKIRRLLRGAVNLRNFRSSNDHAS